MINKFYTFFVNFDSIHTKVLTTFTKFKTSEKKYPNEYVLCMCKVSIRYWTRRFWNYNEKRGYSHSPLRCRRVAHVERLVRCGVLSRTFWLYAMLILSDSTWGEGGPLESTQASSGNIGRLRCSFGAYDNARVYVIGNGLRRIKLHKSCILTCALEFFALKMLLRESRT